MAYRVPLLELDRGVWELPTLKGKPVHLIGTARRFPKSPKLIASRRLSTPLPPLKKPIERTIEFVSVSTHFEHPSQADQELAKVIKVIKVLKQFPQLQVTIQGNYQVQPWGKFLTQLPKNDSFLRISQDRPFYRPYVTKWPNEVESYNSHGQVMDSRARTIQQYLISHGINARRVHTARGQYATRKTFTIIFSNQYITWSVMKPALYLILLYFTSSTQHKQHADPTIVCWQEDRKLCWTDFQATTKPVLAKKDISSYPVLCATTEANAVVYDYRTEAGDFAKTVVRVEFDKRKSWINKTYYFDRKATLIHEQLHFDIVELTGRKIRRILAKQPDSFAATVEAEITRVYAQESTLQRLCDKDTESGNNLKAQARWQASIKKQLDTLRAYKSTPADCEPPQ